MSVPGTILIVILLLALIGSWPGNRITEFGILSDRRSGADPRDRCHSLGLGQDLTMKEGHYAVS